MHFQVKKNLKSNRYHIFKHHLNVFRLFLLLKNILNFFLF